MGLFDSLEQAAGLGGQGGEGSGGGNAGAMGAVAQMLQSQPGGLGGILQKFEGAGLGGAAQSWLGGGQNQALSPDQVQGALGPDAVGQVAGQLGVPPDQAAGHIAQFLPMIMDHLSPGGQAPAGGGGGEQPPPFPLQHSSNKEDGHDMTSKILIASALALTLWTEL